MVKKSVFCFLCLIVFVSSCVERNPLATSIMIIEEPEKTGFFYDVHYNKSGNGKSISFIGDSLTRRYDWSLNFPEYQVIYNNGIGGNTTVDVFHRVFSICNTDIYVFMAGINDIAHGVVSNVSFSCYNKIINNFFNRTNSIVYVSSVLPTRNVPSVTQQQIIQYNFYLKKTCQNIGVVFIDMYDLFVDTDGQMRMEYTIDGVHLSQMGYDVVINEYKKYF